MEDILERPLNVNKSALPESLHGLLRVAVDDVEKVEQDPRYKIDMGSWYIPLTQSRDRTTCEICMAGAVMVSRLDFDRSIMVRSPVTTFGAQVGDKLAALDMLRSGNISSAVALLGFAVRGDLINKLGKLTRKWRSEVVRYDTDPSLFKTQMRQIADELEKLGL